MKKMFFSIIAAALLSAASLTVMAADVTSPLSGLGAGKHSIPIIGKFQAAADSVVVSVDIQWDAMSFTYTTPVSGEWNATEHRYEGVVAGGWSDTRAGVTVTNHSNVAVIASLGFEAVADYEDTVLGTFYTKNADNTYTEMSNTSKALETAENTTYANAPKAEYYFGISGEAITSAGKLGTVTVSIREEVERVSTAEELIAAAELSYSKICLNNDIDLGTEYLTLADGVVLDLNGYKIVTESDRVIYVGYDNTSSCTVKNGTLENKSYFNEVVYSYKNITLIDCTLIADDYIAVYLCGADAVLTDCTLMGTYNGVSIRVDTGMNDELSALELNGNVTMNGRIDVVEGCTVTVKAGTYSFDPTAYVNAEEYTITPNSEASPTSWTVAAK